MAVQNPHFSSTYMHISSKYSSNNPPIWPEKSPKISQYTIITLFLPKIHNFLQISLNTLCTVL